MTLDTALLITGQFFQRDSVGQTAGSRHETKGSHAGRMNTQAYFQFRHDA